MMLRWISLVPPMIELARDASSPSAHRPSSTACVVVGHEQRVGPEHRDRGLVEPLAHARPEQLHEARLGTDLLAAGEAGQRARVVQAEDLDVDPRLREPLPDERVVEPAAARARLDQALDRDLVEHLLLPHERRAALVGERRVRRRASPRARGR